MKQNRGYTLIEILVVIAIIAVLAAIIFAAFGSAREKAREAVCTSQLHQWGLALAIYQQDYDAAVPVKGKWMRPSACGFVPIDQLNSFEDEYHLWKIGRCPSTHYPPDMPKNQIPLISYPAEFAYIQDTTKDYTANLIYDYGTEYPMTYCDMHNADTDFSKQPTWATKRVIVLRWDQHIQNEIVQAHAGPEGL